MDALNEHGTAHMNAVATREISELEPRQDLPTPLAGQLLERRRRRRVDLKSLDGVLRESASIYKKLDQGELSFAEVEVRGRQLRRHSEILSVVEERRLIVQLQAKLNALQTARAQAPLYMHDLGDEPAAGASVAVAGGSP
jgi:hypothetical protein